MINLQDRSASISAALSTYVCSTALDDLPAAVRHEGERAFVNWLGCTLGGCRHSIIDMMSETLAEYSGPPEATTIGRSSRHDIFLSSYLNCASSSVRTFDDTHAEAIVHPTGPVAAAVFALGERLGSSGADVLLALCLGIEFTCRLSKAISVAPAKGKLTWMQTGITGGAGAAIGAGKMLRLSAPKLSAAIGLACSQAAGTRVMNASMALHMIHGQCAPAGLRAALLAQRGFESSPFCLEGKFGFAQSYAAKPNLAALTNDLGTHFELLSNTYKPYPCGVVVNPIVEACLTARSKLRDSAAIAQVTIHTSSIALALASRLKPATELDAPLSLYHWAAAALIRGRAGLDEAGAAALADPAILALQDRIIAVADHNLAIDEALVEILSMDGGRIQERVGHAVGSALRPMTDQQLDQKFCAQAETVLDSDSVRPLLARCWDLQGQPDLRAIAASVC